jgi:hypothetical protein
MNAHWCLRKKLPESEESVLVHLPVILASCDGEVNKSIGAFTMKDSHRQNRKRRPPEYRKADPQLYGGEQIGAYIEPYVDADNIAELLDERRENVLKMAREHRITTYPMSGRVRITCKFRRSEVAADMAKIRRPSTSGPTDQC